ncbi:MAG: hypothetical protein U1F46_14940 [Marinagarivorans sp.]
MKFEKNWFLDWGGVDKNDLLYALAKQKIAINAFATMLFMDDVLQTPGERLAVNLVALPLHALKLQGPATYAAITKAAEGCGLTLCPLVMAVHLRLHYLDQHEGPMLTVSSARPGRGEHFPRGFYLQNRDNHLWLRAYRSTDDWIWDQDSQFVFVNERA